MINVILRVCKISMLSAGLILVASTSCKPEKKKSKAKPAVGPGADATFSQGPQEYVPPAPVTDAASTWTETTNNPTSTFTPLSGCLKEQQIQQMEIIINGAIASPKIVDDSSGSPKYNQGVPGQLTFEFNDGFAYTETAGYNRLMTNQGRITITDFTSYSVDQIKYIKVSLGGHSFRNDEFTEYDFWKGEKVRYRVTETSRFAMNTFTVLINGKEYYKQGALNATLNSKTESWGDENLSTNLVTKKILEESCDAQTQANDDTGTNTSDNQFE